jgi:hypothetical protein
MNQASKAPDSPVKRRRNATNVTEYFKTEDGKKHCTITPSSPFFRGNE